MSALLLSLALAGALEVKPEGQTVLVLELAAQPAQDPEARALASLVAAEVARVVQGELGRRVFTRADLEQVAAVEDEKQVFACEDNGAACIADLAGALGAERVIFGSVAKRGALHLVNLSLFDAARARTIARTSFDGPEVGPLLEGAGAEIAGLFGAGPAPAAAEVVEDGGHPGLFVAGVAVTSAGVAALIVGSSLGVAAARINADESSGAPRTLDGDGVLLPIWAGVAGVGALAVVSGAAMMAVAE